MNSLLLTVFPSYFRDIDKVDELMQDITEQQELAQEISDAISKPVGFGEEFDEVGEALQLFCLHLCGISDSKCASASFYSQILLPKIHKLRAYPNKTGSDD